MCTWDPPQQVHGWGLESAGTSGTPFPCKIFHPRLFLAKLVTGSLVRKRLGLQDPLRPSSEVTQLHFHCVLLVKATEKGHSDTKCWEVDSFSRREHPTDIAKGCRPRGCESWKESRASL